MNFINITERFPARPKSGEVDVYPVIFLRHDAKYHEGLMEGVAWNGEDWIHYGEWPDDVQGTSFNDTGTVVQWADPNAIVAKPVELAVVTTVDDSTYCVLLTSFKPEAKITVIKIIREITGLGLGESKAFVEKTTTTPSIVKDGLSAKDADALIKKLNDIGGIAERKVE